MKRSDKGFTLLELVIVMTLMVLFFGLSGAHFANRLPSAKLGATGRELSGLIRMARIEAMNKREEQKVIIDLNRRTYRIEGKAGRTVPEDIAISVIDPVKGSFYGGEYNITSDPSGSVGACEIVLRNAGRTLRIEIDPVIGAVVVKGDGERG